MLKLSAGAQKEPLFWTQKDEFEINAALLNANLPVLSLAAQWRQSTTPLTKTSMDPNQTIRLSSHLIKTNLVYTVNWATVVDLVVKLRLIPLKI